MPDLTSLSLKLENGRLFILDQQLLPHKEVWIEGSEPERMVELIKNLQVRGAPLIGVAAALSLALFAKKNPTREEFKKQALNLKDARPTAVNLMKAIESILEVSAKGLNADSIMQRAIEIYEKDVLLCDQIASFGASVLEDGDQVLTHCNTGGLATTGVGTALGAIRKAHEQGKNIQVLVDETRPLLQGGRLTTWELERLKIPYTLICDNMAATLMSKGRVTKVIVGADRIAANGDFANKVGTYGLAVCAYYHRVPFYVAAPETTVDTSIMSGAEIPIEERSREEVCGVKGSFGEVQWAPSQAVVYNPAFDVTPSDFVTGWILNSGVFTKKDIDDGVLKKLFKEV